MKRNLILLIMCLLSTASCMGRTQKVDNSTVASFDVERYLGNWYEIARFDHSFERGMNSTVATYTMKKDGGVDVINTGVRKGRIKTSVGKAKLTDTCGLLRVSFFGPFYSDYRVMMLIDDYKYALVGSGSADYLWIMSRYPVIPVNVKYLILSEAERRGYDISKLIWMDQSETVAPNGMAQNNAM